MLIDDELYVCPFDVHANLLDDVCGRCNHVAMYFCSQQKKFQRICVGLVEVELSKLALVVVCHEYVFGWNFVTRVV